MFSWYKYLIVSLVFSHFGFWSGNLFLIAPFPDLCLLVPFYNDLDDVISATPLSDKLILLGDFNARVGTDHQTWEGVIGPEGFGKCNSNGLLLLRKCALNMIFESPTQSFVYQTEIKHPRCIPVPNTGIS